jgi:hypothetical protein
MKDVTTHHEVCQGSTGDLPCSDLLHDWVLEAEVLGALTGDPALLEQAIGEGVSEGAFQLLGHTLVFRALCGLTREDHAAGGLVAVVDALRRAGDLDVVGGALTGREAVAGLHWAGFASPGNAAWAWRKRLLPLQRAREAAAVCEQAARRIRERPDEAEATAADAIGRLAALATPREVPHAR